MNPTYDFKGQLALVTGAAKGMRLATARMFAESGASVVLADLDGDLAAKSAFLIVFCDPLTDRAQFGLGIN